MKFFLEETNRATIRSYKERPELIKEHWGIEQTVLAGGYGYRQILELVQNGADAVFEAHDGGRATGDDRVCVALRGSRLYVANTGAPLSEEGLNSLLMSHSSPKRHNQIGRFGLGFKSMLGLGGQIDLFTRTSGAIRFDPARCRAELATQFNVEAAPGLRLAWPLVDSGRENDPTLHELKWAETVIRLNIEEPTVLEHLRLEIRSFPAEFLLFLPVPLALTLDDGDKAPRELAVNASADHHVLHDSGKASKWRVSTRDVRITDRQAIKDATAITARESVPLAWAIPLESKREEAGRFWAFFPTDTPTYLPGILNAPWKVNSDRNAIIGGEWNSALMKEAADLIVDMLFAMSTPVDPGGALDCFPRQPERADERAAPLLDAVWLALAKARIISDGLGRLRISNEVRRHPRDSAELATQWAALASPAVLEAIVHPTCLEGRRGSRLNALAERLGASNDTESDRLDLVRRDAAAWFHSVASPNVTKAIEVLKLAEAFSKDCRSAEWDPIRPGLVIIPTQSGIRVRADQAILAPEAAKVPGRECVALALWEDAEAKRILTSVMRVPVLESSIWEQVLREHLKGATEAPHAAYDATWRAFWGALRLAPSSIRDGFAAKNARQIRVRRVDGTWVFKHAALLPGALVTSEDNSSNADFLVDPLFHGQDLSLLTTLGISEFPKGSVNPMLEDCWDGSLNPWLGRCRDRYRASASRAREDYLLPLDLKVPVSYQFASVLGGAASARLTRYFLELLGQGQFTGTVRFGHVSQQAYPKVDVAHPFSEVVLRHGRVGVGLDVPLLSALVARRSEPAVRTLPIWAEVGPPLTHLEAAEALVRTKPDEIQRLWLSMFQELVSPPALMDDSLKDLWEGAAKDSVVPDAFAAHWGEVPLPQVFVTSSPELAARARNGNRLVMTLAPVALELWLRRGARNLAEVIRPQWDALGPPDRVSSAVPELAEVLRVEEPDNPFLCQVATRLRLSVGADETPVPCLVWDGGLLLDATRLSALARTDRIRLLVEETAAAGWLNCTIGEATRRLSDEGLTLRRAAVLSQPTLGARLLAAVGGRREPLLHALAPHQTIDLVQQCTDTQLSDLVLAHLGAMTLHSLREHLEMEGLRPPARWGSFEARSFVASLGFPEEFAGSPESRREAEEFVSGPIDLPPLHDFQEDVLKDIETLLAGTQARRRAVVSLPTGGGKTRVTVEAAARLVLAPEGSRRSVVWVAQTDELCEQAVQAFRQVWQNLGAQGISLRIIRLWGGNPNPAAQDTDRPVAVVASIQTLNGRAGSEGLSWLRSPGLLVVDECHHAITRSYTTLLRWLDADGSVSTAQTREEPPILGLSATPFRSDDEESARLARRFDRRWFPADQHDLHKRLFQMGVLARPRSEPLESGIALSEGEISDLARLGEPWEGFAFDKILERINQRLGVNPKRNEMLVRFLQGAADRECGLSH